MKYSQGNSGGEIMYCSNCKAILEWDEGTICPFRYCPECGEELPEKSGEETPKINN